MSTMLLLLLLQLLRMLIMTSHIMCLRSRLLLCERMSALLLLLLTLFTLPIVLPLPLLLLLVLLRSECRRLHMLIRR